MDHRNHVSRVFSVLQRPGNHAIPEQARDWRVNEGSWRRCMERHRLDPSSRPETPVLTDRELREENDRLDDTLRIASEEIDRLYAAVHVAGYAAAFSNESGVVVSERADRQSTCYASSDRPGSRWLEAESGTNGIGTSLVERRPVAVFLNDHFFPEYTAQSCVAVPVYGAEADPIGAINVSTINPVLQEATHQVIFGITVALADRMDERLFRYRFRNHYMLRLARSEPGGRAALLAIDADHQIIGVNHVASEWLGRDQLPIGRSIWSFFEKDDRLLTKDTRDFGRIDLRTTATGAIIIASTRLPVYQPSARPVDSPTIARSASIKPQAKVPSLDDCAGNDKRMAANIRLIRRTMQSQLPVLLLGETGVGKDTLARAIHLASSRAAKPYVAFSCAAVQETLIDSELFGYGGGAFTGAKREGSTGRLMEANGGTLFLDEIGDMPLILQTRLLRVLESGEVMPLGSSKVLRVDLQVIAATHQDLEQRIAEGSFREDLYYRLAGVVVHVPALRERDDLDLMIWRTLEHFSAGRSISLEPEALVMLRGHGWWGNVRELRHVLHRAVQLCDNGLIRAEDLLLSRPPRSAAPRPDHPPPDIETGMPTARDAVVAAERAAIDTALRHSGGNIDQCAMALGVSRATLYRKLRRHQLNS